MAITDKEKGVWGLDQVYNKINQGSIWDYSGASVLHFWNYNNWGRFGLNYVGSPSNPSSLSGNRASSPIQIPDSSNWKFPKSKIGSPWVVRTDGTLWVWGYNDVGVLGLNQGNVFYSSPVQIPGTTWSSICGSQGNAYWMVATKTDNTLWAWGYNEYGNLGQNNKTVYSSPKQVPGTTWDYISSGAGMIHALKLIP